MDCRTETNLLPDPVTVSDPEVEALRQNRLDREIYDAAIQVLRETSAEQPLRTSEVLAEIGKRISTQPKGYQVYGVLLRASKLPGSPINSRKGPGGGYYYGEIENVLAPEDPAQLISAAETAGEVLEGHLYPLVSEWFKVVKGLPNTSHKVSSLKSGGMWSNPDIVALAPFDDLGFFDVEIITAEVKRSSQRWEINFFQAVSHKRFSDRSYF